MISNDFLAKPMTAYLFRVLIIVVITWLAAKAASWLAVRMLMVGRYFFDFAINPAYVIIYVILFTKDMLTDETLL